MRKLVCVVFCVYVLLLATAAAQVTFTTIDVPGAVVTDVLGINNAGDMVGYYAYSDPGTTHGFLYSNGTFTFLDYPGADSTVIYGINDFGQIVGYGLKGDSLEIGFIYQAGSFTPVEIDQKPTIVRGINNLGDMVGGYGGIVGTQGFLLRGRRLRIISPPGSFLSIYATGINNLGEVVLFADTHGYAFFNGRYRCLLIGQQTYPMGINDSGIIVGWFISDTVIAGFSWIDGKSVPIQYPDAKYTVAAGINNSGQVVGGYADAQNISHGFVTTSISAMR